MAYLNQEVNWYRLVKEYVGVKKIEKNNDKINTIKNEESTLKMISSFN